MRARAAIYVRVSTAEQTKGLSIDRQEKDCRDYAEREDIEVIAVYDDPGVSGALLDRPGWNAACADDRVDLVLVKHLDRLNRDDEIAFPLRRMCPRPIYSVDEGLLLDPERKDPIAELRFGMSTLMSSYEYRRIRTRMIEGKKDSAEKGHWRGGERPYGLVPVACEEHPKYKVLAIDPVEHAWLHEVYGWIVDDGDSLITVAGRMNERPIPLRRPMRKDGTPSQWTRQNLKQILKNPRMTGQVTSWGVAQTIPAIYTAEQHARLLRVLRDNAKPYQQSKSHSHSYPLTKRLICGCGFHWSGGKRHGKPNYVCSHHPTAGSRIPPPCDWDERRWIVAHKIEKAVSDTLYDVIVVEGAVWGVVLDWILDQGNVDQAELSRLRIRVDELEDKLSTLYLRITELDSGAFKKVTSKLELELTEARDHLAELEAAAAGLSKLTPEAWDAVDRVNEARKTIDTTTWQGYAKLAAIGEEVIDHIRDTVDVDAMVRQVEIWFGEMDLARIVTELDVKIVWTGRNAYVLSFGVPIGAAHVRAALGIGGRIS